MKSKTLSKSDREEILDAVRDKAMNKWGESPLHGELLALEKEAGEIVHKEQSRIVPEKHRKILNQYGSYSHGGNLMFEVDANPVVYTTMT